jgi:peptide/nickel transport system substrate-binding protein
VTPRLTRRAVLATALASPALATDLRAATLRFVPHQGLGWLDPSWWPFIETRTHSWMVYDTLYGLDAEGNATPQMAEGHVKEDDGRTWRIRLREGLVFHDGTKVRAQDCVASITRWGTHAMMGQSLLRATASLTAPDDRTILFRLSERFPLLPEALGDRTMQVCAIMPARLAEHSDARVVDEVVGSGPFRFLADEYQPWRRAAYARHERYVPRAGGTASFTAGPKVAHFDRVEWIAMPDHEAALAALRDGTVDWWEAPPPAHHAAIAADRRLALRVHDTAGYMATLRMNHLSAPFDDPRVRRAVLHAVDQRAFMAAATAAAQQRRTGVGFFCPASPMARPAPATPDEAGARAALQSAAYRGEPVVVLAIADLPEPRAMALAGAEMLRRIGFNVQVDFVPVRNLVPRLLRTQPSGAGGWSVVIGYWPGHDFWHPGMHRYLRASGRDAEVGWPSSEGLEALRRAWLAAPDGRARKAIAADAQAQALDDLPYIPLGQWLRPTAHATGLTGMLDGFPLFWNLRRG